MCRVVCVSTCVLLHSGVCPHCTVPRLCNRLERGGRRRWIKPPLLLFLPSAVALLDSMLKLTRRNPAQAHHFTANQQEKCSISCKPFQLAEKQRRSEIVMYTLQAQRRHRLRARRARARSCVFVPACVRVCVKRGFSGGNRPMSELLCHFKTVCQHIRDEAESKSSP